jgi:ABC-type Fe3+/spermidine/putrescine transport system ATPase subunit
MLEVRGLVRKVEGAFTLEADFTVPEGGRACLIGKSGSGKTTLLRAIAGLDAPAPDDRGSIRISGRELAGLPPEKRDVGYIFQEQVLFPSMSVLDNCVFAMKLRGVPREERERQGLEWLKRLGLESHAGSGVANLSGGERQRVAFIRALIWKPALLLLDEPFSALDQDLRGLLRKDLLELHRVWPVPMVIVTHDAADMEALATLRLEIAEPTGPVRKIRAIS